MRSPGDDLILAKGEGTAVVHGALAPRAVTEAARFTQAQRVPPMGRGMSGYQKSEQGEQRVARLATALQRVIQRKPEAVKRAPG
jgi:hypothetical protein